MKILLMMSVLFWIIMMQCSQIAGTNDETVTGTACLYMPGGKLAAAEANITLYAAGDTSRVPRYRTETDINGNYEIKKLQNGIYNIMAEKDSLVAYQDSILVIDGKGLFNSDTLEKQGTLSGIIKLQPNDDPRNVIVNITGTNIWSNVDRNGSFSLQKIATGKYTVALIPSFPLMSTGYIITFYPLLAKGGIHDIIKNPLEVTYTGIPLISGLTGTYDTLNGISRISWNKPLPAYSNFREYVIYRADVSIKQAAVFEEYAVATDTFFNDSLSFASSQENLKKYEYMVAIRSKSLDVGFKYESVTIEAISSLLIKQLFLDTGKIAYINVPCSLSLYINKEVFGSSVIYEWDIGNTGKFSKGRADTTITIRDFSKEKTICIAKITGVAGRTCQDTIILYPGIAWEKIGNPFTTFNDIYTLKHNNKIVAITDSCTWETTDMQSWKKLSDSLPFKKWTRFVSFNQKLHTVDSSGRFWTSDNGDKWNITVSPKRIDGISNIVVFQSLLWTIQVENIDPKSTIFGNYIISNTSDLINWNTSEVTALISTSLWFGSLTDSVLWCATSGPGPRWSAFTTNDLEEITYSKSMENYSDKDRYFQSIGATYKDAFILFGKSLVYSPDGLENWKTLPSLNTPSIDDLLYAEHQPNSMILFNERPFFINKDGVFAIK